jgi:hypothetical protein
MAEITKRGQLVAREGSQLEDLASSPRLEHMYV